MREDRVEVDDDDLQETPYKYQGGRPRKNSENIYESPSGDNGKSPALTEFEIGKLESSGRENKFTKYGT